MGVLNRRLLNRLLPNHLLLNRLLLYRLAAMLQIPGRPSHVFKSRAGLLHDTYMQNIHARHMQHIHPTIA